MIRRFPNRGWFEVWKGAVGVSVFVFAAHCLQAAPLSPEIAQFLKVQCMECHDTSTKKGGLDLSVLDWKPTEARESREWAVWIQIHDKVASGEMPPPSRKERPAIAEASAFTNLLGAQIVAAERGQNARGGRTTKRRLNRDEYESTLRDLLTLPALEVRHFLPEDSEVHGFNKSGEALDISHVQMAGYLQAGDWALRQAMAARPTAPEVRTRRYAAWDQWEFFGVINLTGPGYPRDRKAMGTLVSSYEPTEPRFGRFKAPMSGRYRLTFSTYSFWYDAKQGRALPARRDEPVTIYAETPPRILRHLGVFDAHATPGLSTMDVWLMAGETIRPDASRLSRPRPPDFKNALTTPEGTPGVAFQWMEVEGPLFDQWPPMGHRLLFGELPMEEPLESELTGNARKGLGVQVVSKDPQKDVEALMRRFMQAAYRRPVEDSEIARFVAVVHGAMKSGHGFTDAMVAGYTAVLSSPSFLYVGDSVPGPLSERGLAERLSYFLWNAAPDEALRALADQGLLHRAEVLRGETERLLNDPRSGRFVDAFLKYWLDLRRLSDSAPDAQLYPEYQLDDLLIESMTQETGKTFAEMLGKNLGVTNLVMADFVFLNERLAQHYGIEGVTGVDVRKVRLPGSSFRGGFLTQGSVLKVTANGTTTSPVKRGAWVLSRILGRPPAPPPSTVPAIEPDTLGATTIREQLAKHRSQASCNVCHRDIDPAGFALESFDVMGGWRERYRSLGEGEPVNGVGHNGNLFRFRLGPKVDSSGQLPDGTAFSDVRELKRALARDPDTLARNLLSQWVVYATGSPIHFSDRAEVEAMLNRTRGDGHGLRLLIHELVQSRLFREN